MPEPDSQRIGRWPPDPRLYVLGTLVAVQLAVALACIWTLSALFYRSGRVVALHLSLVGGVTALAIAALGVAIQRRWIANSRSTRLCMALASGTFANLLALLYLADAASNRAWGGNINYRLVSQYALQAMPNTAPFFISGRVHAAILAGGLIVFLLYWSGSRLAVAALEGLVWRQEAGPRLRRWKGFVIAAAFLVLACYAAFVALLTWQLHGSGLLAREPLIGFLLVADHPFDFNQYVLDRQLPEQERLARSKYPQNQSFQKRNVIVVIVDSLRADHMSVYGYERPTTPFLSGLAAAQRLKAVQLALSTCAETVCGVLSTTTSKPLSHLSPESFSLGDLLHDQGYRVYQILSGDHDWRGLRQAYGEEQTLYFDGTNSRKYALNDDRVVFEGLDLVPDYAGTPAFFHFHLMSVHALGVKRDAYRRYSPTLQRDLTSLLHGEIDWAAFTNSYDNGVLEADATLEALFTQLDKKGYLANSLAVILADHGEALGEHGPQAIGHIWGLYQEFIRIPLLIYDASDAPYANLAFATQVDVAPTVIDRLGLSIPESWEGHSLFDENAGSRQSYHQTMRYDNCYALVDRAEPSIYKYLRCGGRREELYELVADPRERFNIIDVAPPLLMEKLRTTLDAFLLGPAVAAR